jgi:hypothetical protein
MFVINPVTCRLFLVVLVFTLSVTGCASGRSPDESAVEAAFARAYAEGRVAGPDDDTTNLRVEAHKVPGNNNTFVVIYDWSPRWFGSWELVGYANGELSFLGGVGQDEQSVDSVAFPIVDGKKGRFVEIIGMTHMGHGCLYVHEFEDGRLRLRLKTSAVDFHDDGDRYRDGILSRRYFVSDGVLHLELSGVVELTGEKGDEVIDSFPCGKLFQYDGELRRFVEVKSERFGFDRWPHRNDD